MKSEVTTAMTESSFLVQACNHVYKDNFKNFRPGSFFRGFYSHGCRSIRENCPQQKIPLYGVECDFDAIVHGVFT